MASFEKWSGRELGRQINGGLFEPVILSPAKSRRDRTPSPVQPRRLTTHGLKHPVNRPPRFLRRAWWFHCVFDVLNAFVDALPRLFGGSLGLTSSHGRKCHEEHRGQGRDPMVPFLAHPKNSSKMSCDTGRPGTTGTTGDHTFLSKNQRAGSVFLRILSGEQEHVNYDAGPEGLHFRCRRTFFISAPASRPSTLLKSLISFWSQSARLLNNVSEWTAADRFGCAGHLSVPVLAFQQRTVGG